MQYEDVIGEIDADGNPVSYAWENFFGNFEASLCVVFRMNDKTS